VQGEIEMINPLNILMDTIPGSQKFKGEKEQDDVFVRQQKFK
jgi:hypothetical protein